MITADGPRECAPYRCSRDGCLSLCATDGDCLGGTICLDRVCRTPAPVGSSSSGCVMSPQTPVTTFAWVAALLSVGAFVRRSRRRPV